MLIAGVGMFGIFLFVTYYLQLTLGYSPITTGLSFLPMIGMLVLAAQLGTNLLVPRLGPKVMVPFGMTLGTVGMLLLTRLGVESSYAPDVLVPLMVLGFAMGSIMPASMQTATLGVDRQDAGVASAMVNTSQQVGGSLGTALLNTLAATAATSYLAEHTPVTPAVAAEAAVHSFATAYWWGAGIFAFGAVLSAVVFRRKGDGLSVATARPRAERPSSCRRAPGPRRDVACPGGLAQAARAPSERELKLKRFLREIHHRQVGGLRDGPLRRQPGQHRTREPVGRGDLALVERLLGRHKVGVQLV